MGWRTVVVTRPAKLDLSLGYILVRDAESTRRVFMNEVSLLIIESTTVSLTAALLCELNRQKIKVIFCDEKHNPHSELVPYYGSHDTSRRIREQILWHQEAKMLIWTYIVRAKIAAQSHVLRSFRLNQQANMLTGYISEIQLNDASNREGHAAKVYFNALFGLDFTRDADNAVNAALNYGYSILLSCFNREIVACGYITQLGIFHDNVFNQYNLSCDMMEPFRPYVDRYVMNMKPLKFETEEKHAMLGVLNIDCTIAGQKQTLLNAVSHYAKSIFAALNAGDPAMIDFPDYEL